MFIRVDCYVRQEDGVQKEPFLINLDKISFIERRDDGQGIIVIAGQNIVTAVKYEELEQIVSTIQGEQYGK